MPRNVFGRLRAPNDGRDYHYLMRNAMPQIKAAVQPKPRKQPYHLGPVLDQGQTPQCVGYSFRSFLEAAPVMSKTGTSPTATECYQSAQRFDEWPNEDYEGSSVRGMCKAAMAGGLISGYTWALTLDEAVKWIIGGYGTLLIGSNWYSEMSDVDANGVMREPASSMSTPIGGHAWHLVWIDQKKQLFEMKNSWNHEFGKLDKNGEPSGLAYITPRLLQRLLDEDGEIAGPTQVRVSAVLP